jgi:UPF0755 protein
MRHFLIFIAVSLFAAGGFTAYSFKQWHTPYVPAYMETVVEPGTGMRGILSQLEREGLMPPTWQIAVPFLIEFRGKSLKAGEYAFEEGMSPADMLRKVASGKIIVHHVTIPEGFTAAQVRARLMAEELLTGALPARIAEGSVFPDTWRFQRGEARSAVLARMQARMEKELAAAWDSHDADLPFRTKEEALILASIVEEETGVDHERARVASVYINRLRIPMRLQSDPTVAYGIAPAGMKRPLTLKDLARDHPYNTYTRDGLPPGPICNPGLASIQAVLNPAETELLYFVATGDGGHRFATTLKEHQANVQAYRAVQREQRRASGPVRASGKPN